MYFFKLHGNTLHVIIVVTAKGGIWWSLAANNINPPLKALHHMHGAIGDIIDNSTTLGMRSCIHSGYCCKHSPWHSDRPPVECLLTGNRLCFSEKYNSPSRVKEAVSVKNQPNSGTEEACQACNQLN